MHKAHSTKHAFTLIELLVVTVIIAGLAAIVFRLAGVTGNSRERAETVERMQRLENCLSGYFAAFGSYPPVPLQGRSRNVYRDISANSVQTSEGSDDSKLVWERVRAACQSQPVRAEFPPADKFVVNGTTMNCDDAYQQYHEQVLAALDSGAYGELDAATQQRLSTPITTPQNDNAVDSRRGTAAFSSIQMWSFGLMSFLLPRYRFMLACAKDNADSGETAGSLANRIDQFAQWTDNNRLPCRMDSGISYKCWKDFCSTIGGDDDWQIDLIPSQAACARWLPNLEGIVSGKSFTFFGTSIGGGGTASGLPTIESATSLRFYKPSDGKSASDSATEGGYLLWFETVVDGWYNDFYYYSPPPHQSYVLWSSGPDGKTFPPWIDMKEFKAKHAAHAETAAAWKQDDIIYMSN